jgi:hypothetical protein
MFVAGANNNSAIEQVLVARFQKMFAVADET